MLNNAKSRRFSYRPARSKCFTWNICLNKCSPPREVMRLHESYQLQSAIANIFVSRETFYFFCLLVGSVLQIKSFYSAVLFKRCFCSAYWGNITSACEIYILDCLLKFNLNQHPFALRFYQLKVLLMSPM